VTTAYHPWGRVDADGTVYVRTADGERVIGSWQAGSPEEAIAFFQRKYEALETEVVLLEQRIASTDIAPAQASASVNRLVQSINEANALGDLDGLRARVERLTEDVGHRREEAKAAREQARVQAKEIKEQIVAEAEQIAAEATHWKSSGERMRELLEEWKTAPHAERAAKPRCGSGCPRPVTPSPSGARRISPPWRPNARTSRPARRSWSPTPRPCRGPPTGGRPPARTAS
jgi:outer membrane murein-binding lipoprotein Lpp